MQAILIVEGDESIRRILDLSLRHAGFAVGLASTNEEGVKRLADGPDLVIAGACDADGLAFCRRVKQTGERLPPAVVLISDPGLESKTRGLEAGADDFVVKPIYVQEVVARARALLQRRERERLELSAHAPSAPDGGEPPAPRTDRFVSDISDVPLVDLLRAIAAHRKSGVAVITADGGARGEIFFRQGNVVDAEVGRLSGRDAIYRLFCWSAGRLEVEWKSIRRKDTIEMRPQDLLMEALRRVDEWRRLLAGLPPLDTIFEVDYRTLAERLADIPDEVNRILRLFDGVRTFLQVIDDCGLPDLDAAASIGKLCHERIIHDIRAAVRRGRGASAPTWRGGSPRRRGRSARRARLRARSVRRVAGGGDRRARTSDGAARAARRARPTRSTTICARASPIGLTAEGHAPEGPALAAHATPTTPGMPAFPDHAAGVRRGGRRAGPRGGGHAGGSRRARELARGRRVGENGERWRRRGGRPGGDEAGGFVGQRRGRDPELGGRDADRGRGRVRRDAGADLARRGAADDGRRGAPGRARNALGLRGDCRAPGQDEDQALAGGRGPSRAPARGEARARALRSSVAVGDAAGERAGARRAAAAARRPAARAAAARVDAARAGDGGRGGGRDPRTHEVDEEPATVAAPRRADRRGGRARRRAGRRVALTSRHHASDGRIGVGRRRAAAVAVAAGHRAAPAPTVVATAACGAAAGGWRRQAGGRARPCRIDVAR